VIFKMIYESSRGTNVYHNKEQDFITFCSHRVKRDSIKIRNGRNSSDEIPRKWMEISANTVRGEHIQITLFIATDEEEQEEN